MGSRLFTKAVGVAHDMRERRGASPSCEVLSFSQFSPARQTQKDGNDAPNPCGRGLGRAEELHDQASDNFGKGTPRSW